MDAVEVVLSFVSEMNDWEHTMYLMHRRIQGKVVNHALDEKLVPDVPIAEFEKKYYEIFGKYCTNRKRSYGGQPTGYSRNGQYQGCISETVESVRNMSSNRIEVVIKGGLFPDNRFLFVVLKKNGQWKIDSAKCGMQNQWDTHHL